MSPILCLLPLILALDWGASATMIHGDHEHADYGKPLWNATYTDQLKRDLLATYDKFARPSHHSNTTKVQLDLVIKHVQLDDSKSMMTVNAWVKMTWFDEKLQWNPNDYGGLKMIHLADHEVWQPDIVLYNSAVGNNIDHFGNTHLIAMERGMVIWVPPSQFIVFCDMDLYKWPFDRQVCSLRLGSWTYSGEQVDLRTTDDHKKSEDDRKELEVTEWKVVDIIKKRSVTIYACCKEPYIDIAYYIRLERRSPSYKAVVIMPAICTILLILSSMWLAPHSRQRYILSGLSAIMISIFLIYFTVRLPMVGPTTPLVIVFYASSLLMVSISIVLTVAGNILMQTQKKMPRHLTNILRGKIASSILLMPASSVKLEYEDETGITGEELRDYDIAQDDRIMLNRRSPQESWFFLAIAIDRLFFIIYTFVFVYFFMSAVL